MAYGQYGYHGYPQRAIPPDSQRAASEFTPEVKADTSSPWGYPYHFPPFVDPRSPPEHTGGLPQPGGYPKPGEYSPWGVSLTQQQWDDYNKLRVASSALNSAPRSVSRENSAESPNAKKDIVDRGMDPRPSPTAVGSGHREANLATVNETPGHNKQPPLTRYASQTSNTSTVSTSSQHSIEQNREGGDPCMNCSA